MRRELNGEEIKAIQSGVPISKKSPILSLNPYIHQDGLL